MADEKYRRLDCVGCSVPFTALLKAGPGRPRTRCDGCRDESAKPRQAPVRFPCETCGAPMRQDKRLQAPPRWCSRACKPQALRGLFSCQHCGVEYKKKCSAIGHGEKFCTRSCAFAAKAKTREQRLAALSSKPVVPDVVGDYSSWCARYCTGCGSAGGQKSEWSRCVACVSVYMRSYAEAKHKAAALAVCCSECGAMYCPVYGARMRIKLCSSECIEASRLRSKRASKQRRRALERGAAGAEMVDWLAICERDKWCCQMCGVDTPRALRGTSHQQAPEIDHLVAVALGGTHEPSNLACLCRRCNGIKSDLPLDVAIDMLAAMFGRDGAGVNVPTP